MEEGAVVARQQYSEAGDLPGLAEPPSRDSSIVRRT
jgi:hypothetical protein